MEVEEGLELSCGFGERGEGEEAMEMEDFQALLSPKSGFGEREDFFVWELCGRGPLGHVAVPHQRM